MNKVICDNQECKSEIIMKTGLIETKYLNKGIQLNLYRCNKCGEKYLIDVTNQSTREKQIELRKWLEQRERTLDIVLDGLSKEEFNKLATLVSEIESNINRLTKEIKEAKAELKIKYEGEL